MPALMPIDDHRRDGQRRTRDVVLDQAPVDAVLDELLVAAGYFDALNGNFRYQLTLVGQFAQAVVAEEILDNRFTALRNEPGRRWAVEGDTPEPA
jgi:hypothetical protein